MEKNVGGLDRTGRLVLGPILLVVGIALAAEFVAVVSGMTALVLGGVLALFGLVFIGTGLTQMCIINSLLGINTLEKGS
jgi:hypothetical protein